MSTFAQSVTLDDLETDPYAVYARLRAESPVAFVPAVNSWLVSRWDDVNTVTNTPALFSAEDDNAPVVRHFGKPAIIHTDGEVHKTLRGGIAPYYMPRKVAEYIEPLVRPLAQDRIRGLNSRGAAELISEYFEPVSALSLAHTFGLKDISAETLTDWFHGLSMGAINFERDPERTAICDRTIADIDAALAPVLDRVEVAPDDTPLSTMMRHGLPEGEIRPRDYIMPSIRVALLGGMQEPGHGAATTLVGLLQNPEQLAMVQDDPDTLLPKAVLEGVRWIAPIGTQGRTPIKDTELGGVMIPAGQTVSALIASANRDAQKFKDPDAFDITRTETAQAAFGFGQHFCAGKWFSLAQMNILLRVLFEELEDIRFHNGAAPQFLGWEFRAPRDFHVTFKARAA